MTATAVQRTRNAPRAVLIAVAAIAILVPITWAALLLEGNEAAGLLPPMLVTSVLFWTVAAAWLLGVRNSSEALLSAAGLGLLSPFLCCLLLVILGLLLLPFWPLLMFTPASGWFFLAITGPWFVVCQWEVFLPVGLGMGILTFALTRLGRRART